jgi:hypothetical protein
MVKLKLCNQLKYSIVPHETNVLYNQLLCYVQKRVCVSFFKEKMHVNV